MMVIANRKVTWPRAKDYRKTYMYMWLKKFAEWVNKNDLDDELAQRTIVALVKYAKKNNILRKGASLLQHEKIYEIALREFDNVEERMSDFLVKIKKSQDIVETRRGAFAPEDFLGKSKGIGQLPNIVLLFNSHLISANYIALSSSCRRVLNKLNDDVRSMLPNERELFKIRELTKMNNSQSAAVYDLLGHDYINSQKHCVSN